MIMCREEHAKAIDKSVFPGWQGGPMMHSIAAKAVAFAEALSDEFKDYAEQVVANARSHGRDAYRRGSSDRLRRHRQPPDARRPSAGSLTGKEAEARLDAVGITVNKNAIPYDPEKPFVASGIRVGTPAITTCGMKEDGGGRGRSSHRPRR